jgi:hypothetical protein
MTQLEEKIKQATVEKHRRYPLLDVTDNRAEIREISQAAQDYMVELCPSVKRLRIWEAIPTIVIEFMIAAFGELSKADAMKLGESSVIIGNLFEIKLKGMLTSDGDKMGNISPSITCRSEFKWEDKDLPYIDNIMVDQAEILREEQCEGLPVQFFEDRETIKRICTTAAGPLTNDYGITVGEHDWWLISLVVVAFFRKAKEWLINWGESHKNDDTIGVDINLADVISLGINKEGGIDEDDPVTFVLSITPQQIFKKDHAKGDDSTEL